MEPSFLKRQRVAKSGNHNHRGLFGAIFMCNKKTILDCLQLGLFGLPLSRRNIVEQVVPGTLLFLFEYEEREMHGIFEASSFGGINIEPDAFKSSGSVFPCQVRCERLIQCAPLYEIEFKRAIEGNYFSEWKFKFNLKKKQVSMLVDTFLKKIEDSELSGLRCLVRENCFDHLGVKNPGDICWKGSNEVITEKTDFLRNGTHRDELNNPHCDVALTDGVFNQDYCVDIATTGLHGSQSSMVASINACSIPNSKYVQVNKTGDYNLHQYSDSDAYISPGKDFLPMVMSKLAEQSVQRAPDLLSRPRPPLYVDTTFSSSMDRRECLGPNLILLHGYASYPTFVIAQSDTTLDNEAYPEREHSSLVRDKKHRRMLSLEAVLPKTPCCKKQTNKRVSVWSRISVHDWSMDGYSSKDEELNELLKDEGTDVQLVAEAVADDSETANINYERERNLFHYARKKTLASSSDVKEKKHKRRRMLIRPDFSASVESDNQSSNGMPQAIRESACSKQVISEAIVHSSNNCNMLQHDTNKEKLLDFDLNRLSMETDDGQHLFPCVTNNSAFQPDSSGQVFSKQGAAMPNCSYFEVGSDKYPFSLAIGLNTNPLEKSPAGPSLQDQCDIFNGMRLHTVEVDLHEASVEKNLTLISAGALDISEKHGTLKQNSLATESQGAVSQKWESKEHHSFVKLLKNHDCANGQCLHEGEILPSRTCTRRSARDSICLNFVRIETPLEIDPDTSGILQDPFLKGEESETNMNLGGKEEESSETEPGRTVDYCNQLNLSLNLASSERETEATTVKPSGYAAKCPIVSEPPFAIKPSLRTPAGQHSLGGDDNKLQILDSSIPIERNSHMSEEVFGSVLISQNDPSKDGLHHNVAVGEKAQGGATIQFLDTAFAALRQSGEKEHNLLNRRRQMIIGPDFSASVESDNQSSNGIPQAIQESAYSKQVIGEAIVHSNNNCNMLQHDTNKEKLLDFDLNRLSTETDDGQRLSPCVTNNSAFQPDSSGQVFSKQGAAMLNCSYSEVGSDKCPFSLAIGLNTNPLEKSLAGPSLQDQCDIFNGMHLHIAEVDLHEATFEKNLTLISARALDIAEKHETPKQISLANESQDAVSRKWEGKEHHSFVKLLNHHACAEGQCLHEAEILPSRTHMRRSMRDPICLNFLKVETPLDIEPDTSGILQGHFLEGEESETNTNLGGKEEERSSETEPGRTVDHCSRLNLSLNLASSERETEATIVNPSGYAATCPIICEPPCAIKLSSRTAAGRCSLGGEDSKSHVLDAGIPIEGNSCNSEEVLGSVLFTKQSAKGWASSS